MHIEALQNVTKKDFRENIPSGAQIGSCSKQYYTTQDQPAPVSTEVCGTSYVVDTGSGVGKVVQDCTYKVYEDKCDYTIQAWTVVDQSSLQGSDFTRSGPALTCSQTSAPASKMRATRSNLCPTIKF